jgi:hypothetical protein
MLTGVANVAVRHPVPVPAVVAVASFVVPVAFHSETVLPVLALVA